MCVKRITTLLEVCAMLRHTGHLPIPDSSGLPSQTSHHPQGHQGTPEASNLLLIVGQATGKPASKAIYIGVVEQTHLMTRATIRNTLFLSTRFDKICISIRSTRLDKACMCMHSGEPDVCSLCNKQLLGFYCFPARKQRSLGFCLLRILGDVLYGVR